MSSVALRRSLEGGGGIDHGMLRYVLDQSRDCIKILTADGGLAYINSPGRCELEIADFDAVKGKPWTELWPEGSRDVVNDAVSHAQAGQSSEIEASRPSAAGGERWWRITVSPLLEPNGELSGILIISRDISKHVMIRESEQTLALEMRHRLRNAYTVASAIVMQSARGYPEAQVFAEKVCDRLADVALSQTSLVDAGGQSWSLAELVRRLIEAHGEGAGKIRYAGDAEAAVDGQQAMLVALVIGELTNNSLKYGALRQARSVAVSASVDGSTLVIRWKEQTSRDSQERPQRSVASSGSGYVMMERMARAQGATLEHRFGDGRLDVTLRIPQAVQ